MVDVALQHHVYTSHGGYRTVFVSDDMNPFLLKRLEMLASRLYPKVGGHSILASYCPDGRHMVFTKAFRSGVDHVGRPRACVHTVVVDTSEEEGLLSPAPRKDMFLERAPERSDVPSLRSRMKPTLQTRSVLDAARNLVEPGLHTEPLPRSLLLASVANRRVFVTGDFFELWEALGKVLPIVPRPSRYALCVVTGCGVADLPVDESLPRSTFCCVGDADRPREDAPFISLDPFQAVNMPVENRYSQYVMTQPSRYVLGLVALMERYAPALPLTFDAYSRFINAFRTVEEHAREDGTLDIRDSLPVVLLALKDFVLAGFDSLALDVFNEAAKILAEQYGDRSVLENMDLVRESLSNPVLGSGNKERQVEILRKWITKVVTKGVGGES